MRRKPDDAVRITSARHGKSVDIRSRQTRYLFSMGVRTVCFVLAIVATGPLRWIFLAGAFLLPYLAVVIANTGSRPDTGGPPPFEPERFALSSPRPVELSDRTAPSEAVVEPGEVISR